jgi:hypothetical protein
MSSGVAVFASPLQKPLNPVKILAGSRILIKVNIFVIIMIKKLSNERVFFTVFMAVWSFQCSGT